ncbi:MAG: ATP-dependent zinc metalloprotease FtsH [Bacilli bacterium]|nr:ATP-dependent zinc metalloprotease FtsH [Bacilli bacterium]MDY4053122.1 ATP-dependent zinc metalloprotease FtsH [Bacilli bacterium]
MSEMKKSRKFGWGSALLFFSIIVLVGFAVFSVFNKINEPKSLTPEEFLSEIRVKDGENWKLADVVPFESIDSHSTAGDNAGYYEVSGTYKKDADGKSLGGKYTRFKTRLYRSQYEELLEYAKEASALSTDATNYFVLKTASVNTSFGLIDLLSIILPIVIFVIFIIFIVRSSKNSNNQAFDFGKSRAKLTRKSGTTFKDVAGLDEEKEEMVEIVDFLKSPKKYFDMGARIPKGILLVGSPGTGKTLLARAVAGEANVPFFTISGSDFVEMFVGVGASRVRDMFKTAKQNAPCIIFIDEIDAVGRQRGTGLGGGHDEREQTLNQLLVEMDGFGTNTGIIVMAATNRADILDPALLRPGRFDRQIHISLPDVRAREEILKVHARNKRLSPRVNLSDIAKRTPGFSGADLENLLNEAALLAARENCREIKIYHIDEAVDRVMMGPAKKSKKYTETEKALVAYHESGHAVIGLKLKHASIVQKITIVPRGDAGGYNLMTPAEETFLETKQSLTAQITSLLAGRIAEQLVFNQMTTGAYDDFRKATAIARAMVTEYGMSSLGPIQYEKNGGQVFLGRDYMSEKNFSDQVALEIDNAVRKIINECYSLGESIIKENRQLLDLLAKHLVEIETLTKEDIDELVNTGKLNWWEKKKAKMAEAQATQEATVEETKPETSENQAPTDEENK